MFVLGHLGIGGRLLLRVRPQLAARWLYLGCLLPDLIDKPLYYGLGPSDLLRGSRTFGHTGLFLLAFVLLALILRRPWSTALALGIATHLALDIAGEAVTGAAPDSAIWLAIFYPAYGHFPLAHFRTLLEHLSVSVHSVYVVAGEIIGGAILLHDRLKRAL